MNHLSLSPFMNPLLLDDDDPDDQDDDDEDFDDDDEGEDDEDEDDEDVETGKCPFTRFPLKDGLSLTLAR